MAERKFRSDEEWERYFDEIADAVQQSQWKPREPEKMTDEELESYRHRIDHTRGQKKLNSVDIKTPFNDKWEHGEIFYPHPVWWENEEIIKSLEESE